MREPLARRLRPFTSTIFAEMSALATATTSINLGQGFPDTDGPPAMLQVAREAISAGVNQYPPGPGMAVLREAIAEQRYAEYGQRFDPDSEVLVTVGATEAVAAAILALIEPGDEVLVLEPFYDAYPAAVAMAHGVMVPVRLQPDASGRFALDPAALVGAVTDRTRLILLNSPHDPTGTVLNRDELAAIAAVARDRDLIVVTDEVYEYLTFSDGEPATTASDVGARPPCEHVPIGTLPGMAERTLSVSSAGKSFNVTGWKIGWICGPADLVAAVRAVKQFLTFTGGAPFQPAIAQALRTEQAWLQDLRNSLQGKRNRLCDGLSAAGFEIIRPQGTYFVVADIRPVLLRAGEPENTDGLAFCRQLPDRCGVVAVPQQVFYADPAAGAHLIRFAFCKRDEVIDEAVRRLAGSAG